MRTVRTGRGLLAIGAVTTTVLAMTMSSGANAAGPQPKADPDAPAVQAEPGQREAKGFYDVRTPSARTTYAQAAKTMAKEGAAAEKFRDSLGPQGIVSVDPATGTPKQVAKLNGFLTGPSSKPPARIVLDYIRAHPEIFRLSENDLRTLRLRKNYRDVEGSHHLSWEQVVNGTPLFGNGIVGHVTKRGELIAIMGSPVPGLAGLAAGAATPSVSADGARVIAAKDVGGKTATTSVKTVADGRTWGNGDYAKRVWFYTPAGLRAGWATYTQAGGTLIYSHVIDASTGSVLYRRPLVDHANGDGLVTDYYPGATKGGTQRKVNFFKAGYLQKGAQTLQDGTSVYAFADINDDDLAGAGETVKIPGTRTTAEYRLVPFASNPKCSVSFVCTWDPATANSWRTNLNQDVTQAFYLASNFHDYLKKSPIGFTAAAGNFEAKGSDPVLLNAIDGANTGNGLPDGGHVNNANMNTPPDGTSPTMQMYLFHNPANPADRFVPTSSANDASILYHEYTHGLSNRLVVDASGNSTLNSVQAGGMGEGWSDFYAMDYLVANGFQPNSGGLDGEVKEGTYTVAGGLFRKEAMDCRVGSTAPTCKALDGTQGGYTFADFPNLGLRGPEVHDIGEYWAQVLWDVRERFGHTKTISLVTRAMELSPSDPSLLDMRNAILQADQVVNRGKDVAALWQIFATRGMGWFAGVVDAGDTAPAEDFHVPPTGAGATLQGTVTDKLTGAPVPNALVFIAGHDSGYSGDYADVTDAQGKYSIDGVLPGTYPKLVVAGGPYEILNQAVTIAAGGSTVNFTPRRDWAAAAGGGAVTDFNGPDFAPACTPPYAIDLSQGTGWGSTTGDDAGTPTNTPIPKFIVVALPATVNITTFSVDPSQTCGDPGSAATGGYRIETSADGTTWATAAEGTFGAANRLRYNEVTPTGNTTGIKYVKFWMLSPQVPDITTNCPGPFAGCQFMDMMELQVFGTQ
ncbi:M36 family metallopeptidase [Kribbella ginsengisoli]|uniref:F5/8 type C domain-containing protein n=1 Tax=Kribbella ginsengisoli TaxID=363865 RepID=A0ABP6X161_9ACTN